MLWRFHELHHSQEDMSVLTVFRTHPLIHVSYLIALIPGIVLLANGALPTTLLVIYGGVVAFAHSNTNLGFGPLGRIFVSPNYHRIHHQLDGPQDVNLGFALTIWDQLFHRAVFPTPETIRTDTGLPGRPLVVEQAAERPRHLSVFAAQLVGAVPPDARPHGPPVRSGGDWPAEDARIGSSPDWSLRGPRRPRRRRRMRGGLMVTGSLPTRRHRARALLAAVLSTRTAAAPADLALVAARTALAWIFIYYGAGKLFGWFNGPGLHRTALYFSNTAHLHPGGFFAVLGGVIEFGGGIALALGLGLTPRRARSVRGHGDGDDHRHLGDRDQLADAASRLPVEPGARRPRPRRCDFRCRPIQPRRAARATRRRDVAMARQRTHRGPLILAAGELTAALRCEMRLVNPTATDRGRAPPINGTGPAGCPTRRVRLRTPKSGCR